MDKLRTIIKQVLFGKPYEGELKVGDKIYSEDLQRVIEITKIVSDSCWYYTLEYPTYKMPEGEYKGNGKLSKLERINNNGK